MQKISWTDRITNEENILVEKYKEKEQMNG